MTSPFLIEPLSSGHDRASFSSGSELLDQYLRRQASQDVRRRVTACFVALDQKARRLAGYYTIAAANIRLDALPENIAKRLPRYPSVPAVRIGRLAVDLEFQDRGLGGALLANAMTRAITTDIMAFAMVVDAKDDVAIAFYRHHGFIPCTDTPDTLFLPLKTAEKLLPSPPGKRA